MERFYEYWLHPVNPVPKARALQLAQEAVRRTPGFSDPKYFAAFQLVGAD
ncbi:MAG: CHAT domain-containing protein [Polaromonas sp.]|nr:CHAT domain-containing protein [Gemmatimonadaceae bacterium]